MDSPIVLASLPYALGVVMLGLGLSLTDSRWRGWWNGRSGCRDQETCPTVSLTTT